MTAKSDGEADLERAKEIGSLTAPAVAIATGVVLSIFATRQPALLACIAGATVVVALFARSAGRVAGQQIASRTFPAALGIGALGGLASLLVAAVTASVAGLIWSLHDQTHTPGWAYSYLGKPFLAVLSYGFVVALLLGVVTGLIIRGLIGSNRR